MIPAFNEGARLRTDELDALAREPRLSLVLVDDGSTDGTPALLAELAAAHQHSVAVVTLPHNRGKGEAVRAGLQRARENATAWVGYLDADLSTPCREVLRLLELAAQRDELHVVIGSRVALLGRDIRRSAFRHYAGRAFATMASLTLAKPVYDTQCGAKLLRAGPALDAAVADPFCSRWAFDVELLGRLDRAGVSREAFWEEPLLEWHDRSGSRRSLAASMRACLDLLAIRRSLR